MGVGKGHRIIRMVDGGIRVEGILPDGVTIKDVNEVCISHFSNLSHGMRVNMVFKGDKFPKYGVLSCLSKEQAFVRVNSQ